MTADKDDKGFRNFVIPAPPIGAGGLLGSVYDFRNTSAQSFGPFTGGAIVFAAGGTQNLPAPGGVELTLPLPTDTDFVLQASGVWLAQWNATVESFNASDPGGGANSFQVALTHTSGPDTIRVVSNRVRIQWMRVSNSQ